MPLMLRCDRILLWTILSLTLFGLLMVYSATAASETSSSLFIAKQLIAAAIGFTAMYALMFFDYRRLRDARVVYAALGVTLGLLILAAALGSGANTRRFLQLGFFSLQPSELAKLSAISFWPITSSVTGRGSTRSRYCCHRWVWWASWRC